MGYLGIDIGGSKVALRLSDTGTGEHCAAFAWPPPGAPRQDLDALARAVRDLVGRRDEPVEGVGLALPATTDDDGVVIAWPSRPNWVGINLREHLGALFPEVDVRWADDGDLAALAEARAANCGDLLYVGVGTGIGGGAVVDGKLFPGTARGSFEIGHVVVDRAGPRCVCGRRGCVQASASGPATLERASRARGRAVSFADLRDAAARGEHWAVACVEESCSALAAAVVSVRELLHPSLIVVGGGFAAAVPRFVEAVSTFVALQERPGVPVVPVVSAVLGGLSSLRGAMLLAAEHRWSRVPSAPVTTDDLVRRPFAT